MSTAIKVTDDKLTIEISLDKMAWRPNKGQLVYKPDILSVSTPCVVFEWQDCAEDYALLYEGLVFESKQEAMDEYNFIKTLRRFTRASC